MRPTGLCAGLLQRKQGTVSAFFRLETAPFAIGGILSSGDDHRRVAGPVRQDAVRWDDEIMLIRNTRLLGSAASFAFAFEIVHAESVIKRLLRRVGVFGANEGEAVVSLKSVVLDLGDPASGGVI